jgi:putative Ca2+/H+ antiporter (TMEM165/GDT1 family)
MTDDSTALDTASESGERADGKEPMEATKTVAPAAGPADPTLLAIILTTFTTVFLAELGDKTQLAALLLAAESGRPLLVFTGAALALICSSLAGVLLGRWLATVLPPQRLERISGALMVSLGLWLGAQAGIGLINP